MKYLKFSILAVALLALAAGSAQAQECVAGAKSVNARAEGEAEMVGVITLKCRGRRAAAASDELTLGSSDPTKLEISVTLNTDITNERSSNDMIDNMTTAPGYDDGDVMLAGFTLDDDQDPTTTSILDNEDTSSPNGGLSLMGAVSDDLRTVTWKHTDGNATTDGVQFTVATFLLAREAGGGEGHGFQLVITGLRADASGVGHGGEITATVKVNGTTAKDADAIKVASVMNGLDVSVKAGKGRECDDVSTSATVTIKEGYKKDAIMQDDSFLITFRNIPEGVTVMVPVEVGLAKDDSNTTAVNEELDSFILMLVEGRSGDGVAKPVDGKAMVELSATGTGEVRYTIGQASRAAVQADVDAAAAETPSRTIAVGDDIHFDSVDNVRNTQEWANLMVDFSWDGGDVTMNADAMVYVSFHPTSGSRIPRFASDSEADALLTVEDCVTMLTFPFVSSASGYDTGIVVSNTKDASGSCTATYSGSDDTMSSPMIEGNSHWIFLVSSHMQDYTGRLMVECDFGGIDGYAQINDHMGNANGYLPRM